MFENNIVIFIPSFLEAEKIFQINDFKKHSYFYSSTYKNCPVIIAGVGKTNTAFTASLFFANYKVKYPLLTGICGAYEESFLSIGDVISIEKDYLVDECSYDGKNITTLNEKGFLKDDEYTGFFTYVDGFKKAVSNTVSFIANVDDIIKQYSSKTNAHVENMEGAAFGIAANRFNIKPYHIRAVSNYSTTAEKQKWNIKKASENLKDAIDLFLKSCVL